MLRNTDLVARKRSTCDQNNTTTLTTNECLSNSNSDDEPTFPVSNDVAQNKSMLELWRNKKAQVRNYCNKIKHEQLFSHETIMCEIVGLNCTLIELLRDVLEDKRTSFRFDEGKVIMDFDMGIKQKYHLDLVLVFYLILLIGSAILPHVLIE